MAIPTFVATGGFAGGINAQTPTWPAHVTNDIGILLVESANEAAAAPTGWAECPSSPQGTGTAGTGTSTRLTAFWKRAASAAETDPTVADTGQHQMCLIATFRGCIETGSPFDVSAGNVEANDAATAVSIPGATTTVADCLVVLLLAGGADVSGSAQLSNWANADLANVLERDERWSTAGNGGGVAVATGEKAAAGAYGATTALLATGCVQGRISLALMPPPPAGPAPYVRPGFDRFAQLYTPF